MKCCCNIAGLEKNLNCRLSFGQAAQALLLARGQFLLILVNNQRLGLLNRIKHLLPFSARLLFYNSLVMPLFDYADLVWGDKHNVTLMTSLQVLQNKAAKIILDRPLYSSATHALATPKWVPSEKRRFQRRCIYVYKCLNGLVERDMNFIR